MGQLIIERFVVQQLPLLQSATADGAGLAEIDFGTAPPGQFAEVEIIDAQGSTNPGAQFFLYANAPTLAFTRASSPSGANGLSFFGNFLPPVRFFPNERIIAQVVGCTPGDTISVFMQALACVWIQRELPDDVGLAVSSGLHTPEAKDEDVGQDPAPEGWN